MKKTQKMQAVSILYKKHTNYETYTKLLGNLQGLHMNKSLLIPAVNNINYKKKKKKKKPELRNWNLFSFVRE